MCENSAEMEQLAHFVTKSFEYNNNNRVLDVLNLTTKSAIYEHLKSNDSMDTISNLESDDNDADSVDIDITDVSSNDGNDGKIHNENDNNNINVIRRSSPIKKSSKENQKQLTRNWLISDTPKKKCDNGAFTVEYLPTAQKYSSKLYEILEWEYFQWNEGIFGKVKFESIQKKWSELAWISSPFKLNSWFNTFE